MMHHLNPTPRTRGFTLLELMLVVVVIAILATVAVPTYSEFVQRSRRSDAREAAGGVDPDDRLVKFVLG